MHDERIGTSPSPTDLYRGVDSVRESGTIFLPPTLTKAFGTPWSQEPYAIQYDMLPLARTMSGIKASFEQAQDPQHPRHPCYSPLNTTTYSAFARYARFHPPLPRGPRGCLRSRRYDRQQTRSVDLTPGREYAWLPCHISITEFYRS